MYIQNQFYKIYFNHCLGSSRQKINLNLGLTMKCNLNEILEQKQLTKNWLAKITGVTNIGAIANGSDIRISSAYKIASALDLNIYDVWPNTYKMQTVEKTVTESVMVEME